MQELDRNKAYDLSKLNETELQDVINWLGENKLDSQVNLCKSEFIKGKISDGRYLHYYKDVDGDLLWGFRKTNKEPIDAKELFYTLENIQVDCSNETEERIKEMADVFEKEGYKKWNNEFSMNINNGSDSFLCLAPDKDYFLDFKQESKTTITYDKFMGLFGNKEKERISNLESFITNMQELDINKKYNIENLNEYQLNQVLEWLRKNDRGWEHVNLSDLEGEKVLLHDGEEWITSLVREEGQELQDILFELNRWYKYDDGSLFYVTSECKNGHLYGYGFNKYSWVCNIDEGGDKCVFNNVAKNYKTPATKEEVEERLKQEAIKRGFVKGVEVGCLNEEGYISEIESEDYYLDGYLDEVFWNTFCVCSNVIMKDGVWLEIENDKLPPYKEVPLKWNYETLVGDVTETTDEVSPISSRGKESEKRSLKIKVLKYLLKRDIILTPKQYKKLWKKN